MSELKVNKISPRSGTDITLGDSGDTITIPSGATLDVNGIDFPTSDGTAGQFLQTNGSGVLSFADAGGFDSSTAMLFAQTTAPTGWTKSTTHDNKALRIVSGTASSGGSVAFTTAFASGLSADATTLSTSEMPLHGHPYRQCSQNAVQNDAAGGGMMTDFNAGQRTVSAYTGAPANSYDQVIGGEGGGGSHTHTIPSFAVQYVDVIIATKD